MPAKALTDQDHIHTLALIRAHGGNVCAASRASGIPRGTLQSRRHAALVWEKHPKADEGPVQPPPPPPPPPPPGDSIDFEQDESGGFLKVLSARIKDIPGAIAAANVPDDFEVEKSGIKCYEMGAKMDNGQIAVCPMRSVWVRFRRQSAMDIDAVKAAFVQEIQRHAPQYPLRITRDRNRGSSCLYEISVPDLHIGKLCWGQETGDDYDTGIARRLYEQVTDDLLARAAGFSVEKILLPVGNDLFHIDNAKNTTTAGTPQDVDSRWQRSFVAATKMLVGAVDRMIQVAPVQVVIIPGNHDRERCFYLGCVLEAWYHKCKHVEVDNTPPLRKYVRYGANLLGFTHGKDEKHNALESIMIRERPQDFAETRHREWHLGHYHTKRETKYIAGDTHGGTVVRILPSLSGTDFWHYEQAYVKGPRAAEAYIWSAEDGYVGHFSSNVANAAYSKDAA